MSIRLKKVEWGDSENMSYTRILGIGVEVAYIPSHGWIASLVSGEVFPNREAAKTACEQHAIERIREAVEVVTDHIGNGNEMVNSQAILGGWQPISSAPRDGTEVMAYFNGGGAMKVSWVNYLNELSGWCVTDNKMDYPVRHCDNPSHWMPLPKPPKEGEHG